jgi:hypothetical protein
VLRVIGVERGYMMAPMWIDTLRISASPSHNTEEVAEESKK